MKGALDGTMILVNVPCDDRPKYRTRKGTIAMNVLGVCSPEMEFTYVLPGWEGSAHDCRIPRDAISRSNGLKVPKGFYYLCDGGYTNGEGFLAPYRGHLYHLKEWNNGPRQPQNAEEYFNLRHAKARNVIERCFGLLKGRWGILRSPSCIMEESSASGGGRGRNKRFWTAQKDEVLVEALSELAVDPHWRCENGFRSGYMVRLEEVIGKALPGCGLKATPHIDSRLKTLGAKFRAISQMLNTSGFVWDDEKKMVSVDRAVYDEFCKVHPLLRSFYTEGFADAVNNLEKVAPPQVTLDSSDDEDVLGSGNVTQTVTSPPYKKIKTENTTKKSKRGSGGAGSSNELASLQAFMKDMNVHLSTMATVMARTDDREQRVTPTQVFEVANILTAQPNKLMIFSKCPGALKGAYVKSLLGGSGDGSA
uniref:Myb/SANT-like domain-containing protein n=1 Tax=Chenopodium quinoa TaxID=63459 RepID=A0A803MID6_CHEQI